jgi:hypothetical protein
MMCGSCYSLNNAFVRPDTFLHYLIHPVSTARAVLERDWKALELHLDLLLHTLEHAKELGMMPVVLHVNNLKHVYGKWLVSEKTRLWVAAAGIFPLSSPKTF